MPSRERKICSRKYLHVLENRICYWIVQVSPESSDREVQKYLLGLWNVWWHMRFLLIYEHPIWYWIIILTRTNIGYGFFYQIYRRCPPRYKAADAKEIGRRNLWCQCGGINKRTIKFQTSWMKDRPWLFHDEETDR